MSKSPPVWLRWALAERGALLWVSALWAAAALVLFGIVQATTERTFYNHTLDLRVALGPLEALEAEPADAATFVSALREGLESQRGFTMLRDDEVRQRVATLLGEPLPREPKRWMRATRNLNVSVYLTARLARSERRLHASVALWNVGTEEEFARFSAWADAAPLLGRALADSVGLALFAPPGVLQASR